MALKRNRCCKYPFIRIGSPIARTSLPRPAVKRQQGAFAIMFIPLLIVMIGFCGLALDIGQLYNRKVDLNGIAKSVAMAAARELNGTDAGIAAARAKAKEIAETLRYQRFGDGNGIGFAWKDAALSFSTTSARTGQWVSAPTADAPASALFFAKVDTASLDAPVGNVDTFFIRVLSASLGTVHLSDSAVAGRTAVNVTPLAICAMSTAAASVRASTSASGTTLSELVQYGFRRGVSYDLMQLNPNATTAARYVVNPVIAPDVTSTSFDTSIAGPFMCAGTMWVPRVMGGKIRVSELPLTSPLASMYAQLNSRFDVYGTGPCDPSGAPPDYNIKEYAYDQDGVVRWMSPTKGTRAAATTTANSKLETVADVSTVPASPGDYGPLWAYAKAAKAPDPLDSPEPDTGYPTFSTTDWPTLYKSGPTVSSYPSSTPHNSTSTTAGHYSAPKTANLEISTLGRRVLNIPLLSCSPASPSGSNVQADVLAIGKFFMTVQATSDKLIAEFAGVLPEKSLSGQVELFP
jgi:Flp pilus assembly protein TadG